MATWEDVRGIALALPGASEEIRSQGLRAWVVQNKFFVWERPLRKSDLAALGNAAPTGAILGVRTADLEMKDAVVGSDPSVYFTIPHFDGYPAVLIRLEKIKRKELSDIITEAWLARAPKRAVKEFLEQVSRGSTAKKRQ